MQPMTWLALAALTMTPDSAPRAGPPAAAASQAATNNPILTKFEMSPARRALGEHGKMRVRGRVVNGRLGQLERIKGTASPALDAELMRKLNGLPIARNLLGKSEDVVEVEVDALNVELEKFAAGYSCRQWVADEDWYKRQVPGSKFEEGELYDLMIGVALVLERTELAVLRDPVKRPQAWLAAIDACRARPNELMMPVLHAIARAAR